MKRAAARAAAGLFFALAVWGLLVMIHAIAVTMAAVLAALR